jgi:hypothetical protein
MISNIEKMLHALAELSSRFKNGHLLLLVGNYKYRLYKCQLYKEVMPGNL